MKNAEEISSMMAFRKAKKKDANEYACTLYTVLSTHLTAISIVCALLPSLSHISGHFKFLGSLISADSNIEKEYPHELDRHLQPLTN